MTDQKPRVYQDFYTPTFSKNYRKYQNIQNRIDDCLKEILSNPFAGTEALKHKAGFDLKGLRSARIDRNFRVIFCVWKEYQRKSGKTLSLLPGYTRDRLTETSVIFMTVGPHEKAYALK